MSAFTRFLSLTAACILSCAVLHADTAPAGGSANAGGASLSGSSTSDPNSLPPEARDTDGDGLSDLDEVSHYGTNPNKPDTDGDGLPDAVDGWPRDSAITRAPLPDVRYAIIQLKNFGITDEMRVDEIDDAGDVLVWTGDQEYWNDETHRIKAHLWVAATQQLTLIPLFYDTGDAINYEDGVIEDTFSTVYESSGWDNLSPDGRVSGMIVFDSQDFKAATWTASAGVISYERNTTPLASFNAEGIQRRSYITATNRFGVSVGVEYGGGHTHNFPGDTYYGYHGGVEYDGTANPSQSSGGWMEWANLASTGIVFSKENYYEPEKINDQGMSIGVTWSHYVYPMGSSDSYSSYILRHKASGAICINGQIHGFGEKIYPIALTSETQPVVFGYDGNNARAWRAVKTDDGWNEGLLRIWDRSKQSEDTLEYVTAANDRLEITAPDKIIRNGILNTLTDLMPTGWHDIYPYDINNHGVILAGATRTVDDQGQSIFDPQPEPVLLVPVEVKIKSLPYSTGEYPRGPVDNLIAIWPGDPLILHADLKIELSAEGLPPDSISWSAPNHEIAANSRDAIFNWSTPGLRMIEVTMFGVKKKVFVTVPDIGTRTEAEATLLDPFGAANTLAYSSIASSWASAQGDNTGTSRANALQHSYWNALMASDALMGQAQALFFSTAHENSNRFRDEGLAFDSAMDLNNNLMGSMVIHTTMVGLPDFSAIQNELLQKLRLGNLWIIAPFSTNEIGHIIKSNGKKIFTIN